MGEIPVNVRVPEKATVACSLQTARSRNGVDDTIKTLTQRALLTSSHAFLSSPSQEHMRNLVLELATMGDLKVVERPAPLTLRRDPGWMGCAHGTTQSCGWSGMSG